MPDITYRPAERGDIELIMKFIRDLAEYEKLADQVVADAGVLADWLFEKRVAKVVFALCDGVEAGFALYFHNFSTFLAAPASTLRISMCGPSTADAAWAGADAVSRARVCAARLRAAGVVLPGLEPAQHRLLPRPRRRAAERVDDIPAHRRGPGGAGQLSRSGKGAGK